MKKSDGTLYWVDDNFHPLSIGTASGLTKDFVFLGDKRIAFVSLASGNAYYYLSDHLGSTGVIASGDGKSIQWEADYFPFSNQRQVFTSSVNNPYKFTGYEYDSDTQQDYAVARFEAGRWGRFLSPDPYTGSMDVSNPQSLNRYSYVVNNPTKNVDPLGLVAYVPGPYCQVGDFHFAGLMCEILGLLPKDPPNPGSSRPAIHKNPPKGACLPAGVAGPPSAECLAERPPIHCGQLATTSGGYGPVYTATGIFDLAAGSGPAVSISFNPATNTLYIAPGAGANVGHSVSFGTLFGANPSKILPGLGLGLGYNTTPWKGVQAVLNSSGSLAGNSVGVPGASATLTYGFCIAF